MGHLLLFTLLLISFSFALASFSDEDEILFEAIENLNLGLPVPNLPLFSGEPMNDDDDSWGSPSPDRRYLPSDSPSARNAPRRPNGRDGIARGANFYAVARNLLPEFR